MIHENTKPYYQYISLTNPLFTQSSKVFIEVKTEITEITMDHSSNKKQHNQDIRNANSINTFGEQQGVYDQINQHFQEENAEQKTVQEARDILGKSAEGLTDSQVNDLVNEVQYLVDTWIEEYEQKVFDGKTLKELLQLNL